MKSLLHKLFFDILLTSVTLVSTSSHLFSHNATDQVHDVLLNLSQDLTAYPTDFKKSYFPLQHKRTLRSSQTMLEPHSPLPPRLSDLSYYDLQNLFTSALAHKDKPVRYKPSFTFMSIDLKYTAKKEIKILEFNAGKTSGTFGYQRLYGPGIIWRELWDQLEKLNLRPFVVSRQPIYSPRLLRRLSSTGGAWAPTLEELTSNPLFEEQQKIQHDQPSTLNDYSGIVIYRYRERIQNNYESICLFRNQYPGLLTLDEISSPYQRNKLVMSMLFEHANLNKFRPRYRAYPKKYTPQLAQTIKTDFPDSSRVVIKPFDSSQGYGIIIVDHHNLDALLQTILNEHNEEKDLATHGYSQRDINYWKEDKNDFLMIEEFISSKPITVDEQLYDPTMRVFCSLYNDSDGEIVCNIWGHYWKLPSDPLNAPVNFNNRHKSNIHDGPSSARVSSLDRTIVHDILSNLLPALYRAMHHIDLELQQAIQDR